MKAQITRKLTAIFLAILLSLLALEGLVRWWGYAEHYMYDPIYMPYPASDEIAYVHRPNLEGARARGNILIHTDSLGLRSDLAGKTYPPKQPGEIRIAIVGDSFTFGEGVANIADIYPERLENALSEQTDVPITVFNFGVSGYSVRDMAATLEYRMLSVQPDLVIMALVPQDFVLARTGAVDPTGYVYDPASGFLKENWLLRNRLRDIHLLYILRDIRLFLPTPPSTLRAPTLPASYEYVLQFRNLAEENNLPYLIVWLPILSSEEAFHDLLFAQMQTDTLHPLDLSKLSTEFTIETFAVSSFDKHPSAAVHQRIAEELLSLILAELEK